MSNNSLLTPCGAEEIDLTINNNNNNNSYNQKQKFYGYDDELVSNYLKPPKQEKNNNNIKEDINLENEPNNNNIEEDINLERKDFDDEFYYNNKVYKFNNNHFIGNYLVPFINEKTRDGWASYRALDLPKGYLDKKTAKSIIKNQANVIHPVFVFCF